MPKKMLTADNITDEQIRELRDTAREAIEGRLRRGETWTYDQHVYWNHLEFQARVALGESRAKRGSSRAKARARCAEIWNQRTKETL